MHTCLKPRNPPKATTTVFFLFLSQIITHVQARVRAFPGGRGKEANKERTTVPKKSEGINHVVLTCNVYIDRRYRGREGSVQVPGICSPNASKDLKKKDR